MEEKSRKDIVPAEGSSSNEPKSFTKKKKKKFHIYSPSVFAILMGLIFVVIIIS